MFWISAKKFLTLRSTGFYCCVSGKKWKAYCLGCLKVDSQNTRQCTTRNNSEPERRLVRCPNGQDSFLHLFSVTFRLLSVEYWMKESK